VVFNICLHILFLYKIKARAPSTANPDFKILTMHKSTNKGNAPEIQISTLPGTYQPNGNNYYLNQDSGIILKLCNRKEPGNKPGQYITLFTAPKGFTYLSSLYPTTENLFTAEIQGYYFSVYFNSGTITIAPKMKNRLVYQVRFNDKF
jgi:hypothetical protein